MPEEEKVRAVHEYLQAAFPGCTVENTYEFTSEAHRFRINQPTGTHIAMISEEFLNKVSASEIAARLSGFTLVEHLREMGTTPILVTPEGLKLEFDV